MANKFEIEINQKLSFPYCAYHTQPNIFIWFKKKLLINFKV